MNNFEKINENIYRLTIPYKDIYTTVYIVITPKGALLFDSASYDTDITDHIMPAMEHMGISKDSLKYVFISHNHRDHAGGLYMLMKLIPEVCIVSRCPVLKKKYADFKFAAPGDGDVFLDVLKVVTIPGHTMDSSAILDMRTNTLITGDCMQLYGIFGSGLWASAINYPSEHIASLDKLAKMDISEVLTAHDYHPMGHHYTGSEAVLKAIDLCIEPLDNIRAMILSHPDLDDEEICRMYNRPELPTLGAHIVTAVRNIL